MASYNRTDAVDYATSYWDSPCTDDVIATTHSTVSVKSKFKEVLPGEKESNWMAQFKWDFKDPRSGKTEPEAACFVDLRDTSNVVMFHGWQGMNDCAHFVSCCLKSGGESSVFSSSVPILESNLRGLKNTKTFGDKIDFQRGARILATGHFRKGDVIIYYAKGAQNAGHSAIYMGEGLMTCHTRSRLNKPWQIGNGYRYRLIHFGDDDAAPMTSLKQALRGWWEVSYGTAKYYYYYQADGKVAYVKKKPASTQGKIVSPKQRGYWFGNGAAKHTVIWSDTGSVEQFQLVGSNRQVGDYNGSKNSLKAEKL